MTPTRRAGLLLALGTAGISGVAVYLNSFGVRAVGDAGVYTTAKNLLATVVLLGLAGLGRRDGGPEPGRPAGPRQWAGLGAIAVIGGSVPFLLFFEGLARASSVQSAFLHKTLVLWVALLAVTVLKERLTAAHGLAVVLLLAGQLGLAGGVGAGWGAGETMILAATLLWSVEVVVAKRLLATLSSWTVGLARLGGGAVLLLGWVLLRGQGPALLALDAEQWGWVALTGVLLAGYVATWFAALARAQAVDVTAVLVTAALVTAALSAAGQGTVPAGQLLWLAALALGGALVAWRWQPAGGREVPAVP